MACAAKLTSRFFSMLNQRQVSGLTLRFNEIKAMASKKELLKLYKSLIRESQKFASYNFRNYAIRRVNDAFRENRSLSDHEELKNKIAEGYKSLETIRRQALISQMYQAEKLVIENIRK
ncbi:LYR motif-containing protein 4 [Dendroctonus ponderosae]